MRKGILSQHPICASCLCNGIITQTESIDHVFAHRQNRNKFLINLFQGLCNPCHTQKTKLESQGIYRHFIKDGPVDYSEHDYSVKVLGEF
jgi:5-methylcytosine-specific restriction endonuclease McrA